MFIDANIWADKKFGGEPIVEVIFKLEGEALQIGAKAGVRGLSIYFGSEQAALNFKNQVLWAWEEHLRSKNA